MRKILHRLVKTELDLLGRMKFLIKRITEVREAVDLIEAVQYYAPIKIALKQNIMILN